MNEEYLSDSARRVSEVFSDSIRRMQAAGLLGPDVLKREPTTARERTEQRSTTPLRLVWSRD